MWNKNLKIPVLFSLLAALFLLLGACSNTNDHNAGEKEDTENTDSTGNSGGMDHGDMDMSGSGEVPEGLKEAENPKYEVGSKAIIESDHMKGMNGATAEIDSAEATTVYMVDFTTTDGEKVTSHKWVTESELSPAK